MDTDSALEPVLAKLLQYDVEVFAATLDLANVSTELSDADAAALLNLAERYSRRPGDGPRNRCLVICGLLWEHRRKEWPALPAFIAHLLSRLGLGPAMPMVDDQYDSTTGRLLPLGSVAMETAVVARSMETEVELTGGTRMLLSEFQHDVWTAIDRYRRLGISAPTSAGKSHVLVHKVLDILSNTSGVALFVVPTLSLVNQVSRDIRIAAARHEVGGLEVLQTYSPGQPVGIDRVVYVLTQERALAALGHPQAFVRPKVVVIDEVQNIERVATEDDERSRALLDVIEEIEARCDAESLIISGPRLENIAQLARQLLGPDAESVSADLPPVVNLTYALSKAGRQAVVKQYSAISDVASVVEMKPDAVVPKSLFGGSQYNDDIYSFLADVARRVTEGSGTLVFSPTSRQATKTAIELATRVKFAKSRRVASLAQYVAESVHPNYGLTRCLDAGIAFHHGKMPHHIRVAVERAFSDLDVSLVACTTTLLQGVNLPAKNLIARNPRLYIRRGEGVGTLTAYEFANLRGRAGRLLKDFVGRVIVLDEGAFASDDIDFGFPGKEVATGYRARFQANQSDVIAQLRSGDAPRLERRDSDLVVHVRQTVLRHGHEALERLQRVGITISDHLYSDIRRQLEQLTISPALCGRLPYWDPFVLDGLYRLQVRGGIPTLPRSPFVAGFVDDIVTILGVLRSAVPYYYSRYFNIIDRKMLQSVAIMAKGWACQEPLADIIGWGANSTALSWEAIDDRISRLNKQVVHDLPKLLRSVSVLQGDDNPILGFIEAGAYLPGARRLIDYGLPREIAIKLARAASPADLDSDREFVSRAKAMGAQVILNPWERMQIEDAFG